MLILSNLVEQQRIRTSAVVQNYVVVPSLHEKHSTRPRPIVPSTCHMCHIGIRHFCDSDYTSNIARAEPDGSAILGPEG